MLVMALLTACAEERDGPQDDRHFANEERTSVPTELPEKTPIEVVEAPTATSPRSGETLLRSESAPQTIVFPEGNELRIVDIGRPMRARAIAAADGERFIDWSVSPDSRHIAVLALGGDDGAMEASLLLLDTSGTELERWELDDWVDAPALASPEAVSSTEGLGSISWNAGNDRILVTLFGKSVLSVSLDGDIQEILVTSRAGTLLDATWSPTGDQIALQTLSGSGTGTVWVFNPSIDGDSFKQVVPPPADAANLGSVTMVEWLPDGSGLAYILAQDSSEAYRGGQLYAIDLQTRERRVIATPGRGGPSAQITSFALSPDGTAVAYTIETPVGDSWEFHSLWIRSVDSASFIDLPTVNVTAVQGYWWVGDGFAWRYQAGDNQGIAFRRADEEPGLLWAPEPPAHGTPQASPVVDLFGATPVAEEVLPPDASPAATAQGATPDASPFIATPVATPMGATPAATPASG